MNEAMTSFNRTLLFSVFLHLAVAAAGYRIAVSQPHPRQVETTHWMIGLDTSLLTSDMAAADSSVSKRARYGDGGERAQAPPAPPVRDMEPPSARTDTPAEPLIHKAEPVLPVKNVASGSNGAAPQDPPQAAEGEIGRAFANVMSMQMVMVKLRQFYRISNKTLMGILEQSISIDERKSLEGSTGTVIATYREDGSGTFSIAADNEGLRALLNEKVRWNDIPIPKAYLLPYKTITYSIRLANGMIGISIAPG